MSSHEWPDLSCLASLARDQSLDVRPILLRVHTDLFVAAPSRDRATIEAFEALALGFLPTVNDATATNVARKLAPVADTPAALIDALMRRGGETRTALLGAHGLAPEPHRSCPQQLLPSTRPHDYRDDFLSPEDDADLALARARDTRLAGPQLDRLIERGRSNPQLAIALLARHDLSTSDEAVLYLHADNARRAQIRSSLEPVVAIRGRGQPHPRSDQAEVASLLAVARALDISAFEAQLSRMVHLDPAPRWQFQLEPRRELLALALVAAGVAAEDCIRVFLTFHPAISRCTATVFHLAQVARSTTRPVAIHLVEAVLGITIAAKQQGHYIPASDSSVPAPRDRARRPTLSQIRAAVLARRTA